jgi:hypothetical protein
MSLLDMALSAKIKKSQDAQEKADKQLQASKINNGIIELAKQSGDPRDLESVTTVLEHVGNTDPEVSKIIFQSIESRIKDKTNFQQTMETEKFKSKMSFVPELTKAMASSGKYSPEQIQEFAGLAAEKAQSGISQRIAQTISQPGQAQGVPAQASPASPSEAQSLFSSPIPAKLSSKEKDFQNTLSHGISILDDTEKQFNLINEKYGVGRVKGLMTEFRGKLGDILPKGEQAPEVVPYMNNLEGLANFIGKTIYRDERVSDVNIKGYKKALAELTNTPEEAKILFDTLRRYANAPSYKDEAILRRILPKSGGGMTPSEAVKQTLTREEKIELLKKRGLIPNGK